jgi:tagatose-1,6-bisphosphate aldolase non-catalytic subunit AgaZ/GatZ
MKRVYTTANGKKINLDSLISQNDDTIAVGNMKVNARGDQLGPGGKVETNKNQVMQDYYKLNTPVAVNQPGQSRPKEVKKQLEDDWIEPEVVEQEVAEEPDQPKLRGSLADSIAKNKPADKAAPKKTGPQRI